MLIKIRYLLEGLFVKMAYIIFGILPLNVASATAGCIATTIGPILNRNKIARKNIKRAIPELNDTQIDKITHDMWNNLGRVFGEFPHMAKMEEEDFDLIGEIDGFEHIEKAIKNGKGSILFSGHFANWEIVPRLLTIKVSPFAVVYRKGNNPMIENIIQNTRKDYQSESIPKGSEGSRQLLRAIRNGTHVGILVDQKMNDGIKVNYFGRGAMTAPAVASIALKFECPIIPIRAVRVNGAYFKVLIQPPLDIKKTGDKDTDILKIMTDVNSILESWVREYPSQWIWIHNRWPKEELG